MNHLLRRQWLEMAALALLCLGLLSRPQAAAQGFADGARLCVGSLLPALFPFMVVCELLVGMAFRKLCCARRLVCWACKVRIQPQRCWPPGWAGTQCVPG